MACISKNGMGFFSRHNGSYSIVVLSGGIRDQPGAAAIFLNLPLKASLNPSRCPCMKTRFIAVLVACLFLTIGAVAGGHGKDKDKGHGHGHDHDRPNHYAAPCRPEHP